MHERGPAARGNHGRRVRLRRAVHGRRRHAQALLANEAETQRFFAPAGTDSVEVRIPAKSFGHYDGGWQFERRTFRLLVGRHAADDLQTLEIELR
jgi:hypothetical protein